MKILVTGASGFAGAHFLRRLIRSYPKASFYCPVTYTHGGSRARLQHFLQEAEAYSLKILEIDLAGKEFLDYFVQVAPQLIFNFASESHVDRSIHTPLVFCNNNIALMLNVLELSRISDARLIHISTDEVYGPIPRGQDNFEWERAFCPSNPYSASKVSQEALIISYFRTFQIDATIVNLTNLAGEAQNLEKFIPKVTSKILDGDHVQVDTDIEGNIGYRKYLDVQDMCDSLVFISSYSSHSLRRLLQEDSELPLKFHISGIREVSNDEMVRLIAETLNSDAKFFYAPSPRTGYDLRYDLSMRNLPLLGWKPKIPIGNTIKRIVDFELERRKTELNL